MASYFDLSVGDMYQSKLSLRPSSSGDVGGEGKDWEVGLRRAEAAVMRWALEEGTSHVGRVEGTSGYSCRSTGKRTIGT